MDSITIRTPDDWHVHLRDGEALQTVARHTAAQFARAIIMPNLTPPLTTVEAVAAYRARIMAALPVGSAFEPLMTLYLTDGMSPETIRQGKSSGIVTAAKLYPAHATTNSAHGVTAIDNIMPALEAMAEVGMPLCVHGEVTDRDIDIFDREAVFIERTLGPLVARLPELKVIFRAHHDATGSRIYPSQRHQCRGDDHAAAPPPQPQCDLRRWLAPARLLPTRAQG